MKGLLVTISAMCFSMAALNLSQHVLPGRPDISGFLAGIVYWPAWDLIFKLRSKPKKTT